MLTYLHWELHSFPNRPEGIEIIDGQIEIDPALGDTSPIQLSSDCLSKIEKVIDQAGFWNWRRSYFEDGVFDGTQWLLKVRGGKTGNRRKTSEGSNLFPKGWETIDWGMRELRQEILRQDT